MYVLAIYLILSIYILFIRNHLPKYRKKLDLIIASLLILFFMIRYNIGRDLVSYNVSYYVFRNNPNLVFDIIWHRNTLYYSFIYACVHWIDDYRWVMLIINIFSLLLCSFTIYKHSKDLILSALLFIGSGVLEVYYASGIRQMIAMSIFFYAFYTFLPKKKYLFYELLVAVAFLFHETIFPAFLIPLFCFIIPLFRKHPLKFTICSAGIALLVSLIISFVLPKILSIEGLHWGFHAIISYFSHFSPSIPGIGMETIILGGVLYLYCQKSEKNDLKDLQYLTILYSVLIYYLFVGFPNTSRISDALQIILIIYLPELISCMQSTKRILLTTGVVLLFNLFLLYSDLHTNLPAAGESISRTITIENDPYITVFNAKWIDESFRGCEWYPFHRY